MGLIVMLQDNLEWLLTAWYTTDWEQQTGIIITTSKSA